MMKKLMIAAATAGLVVSLPAVVSAASLGLEAGVGVGGSGASVGADVGVGADTSTGGGSAGASTPGEGAGPNLGTIDVNGVLASFATTEAEVEAIADLQNDTPVKVIGIDAIANANADVFAKAVADNQGAIAELQAAIAANADFKSELEAANVAVDTIVAADVAADGALTLYTKS